MREIELKFTLDASQEQALRVNPVVDRLALGQAQTRTLYSVYYDTPDGQLRAAGIALRLRRIGRNWVQTLKQGKSTGNNGLFSPLEVEYPVAGQNIDLTRIPDHDLREHLIGIAQHGLVPVAETRFRRTTRLVRFSDGSGQAELAIDKGTLASGEVSAELTEAELELKQGAAAGLYDLAEMLLSKPPVRFSEKSKSERAFDLSAKNAISPLRKARPVELSRVESVEAAAIMILSEGIAHAAPNLALILDSDDISGPHQLRVGLRRLRSSLSAFRDVLGYKTLDWLIDDVRQLSGIAGQIRDLDVLVEDFLAPAIARDPDEPGYAILAEAVCERRNLVRRIARGEIFETGLAMFPLRAAGFVARRGWIDGCDHDQMRLLSQPVLPHVRKVLNRRWKAVARLAKRIEKLSVEERHDLRKEVKKLRYMVDAFRTLLPVEEVKLFTRQVKRMQKAFGALNDAATVETLLMGRDAPELDNPAAQRAANKIIGALHARSEHLWPDTIKK